MSDPIIFISNQKIKAGKAEEYKEFIRGTMAWIEANRPLTIANLAYFNEDETEASIVITFPNAEAMQTHMQGMGELPKRAFEHAEVVDLQIFGAPNEATLQILKMMAGSGIVIHSKPHSVGGYIRFKPE